MQDWARRAISTIRERYPEPLCLDDLAKAAAMSKFHFLRRFRELTGVTPVRFLSAVRIHEAKRLLFATPVSVVDVSVQVGYESLGSFTRRFTECVGLPPTAYRRMARGEPIPVTNGAPRAAGSAFGTASGTVTLQAQSRTSSPIFVGMFESHSLHGRPVASATVTEAGPWHLGAVPTGSWHLFAAAAAEHGPGDVPRLSGEQQLLVGASVPVRIDPGRHAKLDLITVRPLYWAHPPLLLALPGIEALALARDHLSIPYGRPSK